jgi:hypothetical protein
MALAIERRGKSFLLFLMGNSSSTAPKSTSNVLRAATDISDRVPQCQITCRHGQEANTSELAPGIGRTTTLT